MTARQRCQPGLKVIVLDGQVLLLVSGSPLGCALCIKVLGQLDNGGVRSLQRMMAFVSSPRAKMQHAGPGGSVPCASVPSANQQLEYQLQASRMLLTAEASKVWPVCSGVNADRCAALQHATLGSSPLQQAMSIDCR